MSTKFDELTRLMNELQKKIETTGREALIEVFQEVFLKHPIINAISWTQYSPYFNDGDECVFGVNEFHVKVLVENITDELLRKEILRNHEDEDEEDDYVDAMERLTPDSWYVKSGERPVRELTQEDKVLIADVMELQRNCDMVSDIMRAVFGNHVQVTVTKDGFDIQEYDHD